MKKENEFSKLKNSVKLNEYMNIFSLENNKAKDLSKPKVFIFISVDLVNSTSYKQYDKNWPNVFSDFFSIVQENFISKIPGLAVWKYVGDEVLFYKEIDNLNSILESPSEVFKLMESCQKKLHNDNKKSKNRLYLKSTIWIAPVRKSTDTECDIVNVIPDLKESIRDYIGVDIDEGFRISKFSSQGKLVVDATLAYILLKNKETVNIRCDYNVEDRLKIVGYRKLKGIWENRLYPIIWYHKSWADIDSMYLYDEEEISDICKSLKTSNYEVEPISRLHKILSEVNLIDDKVNKILDIVKNYNDETIINNPAISKLVQLHCVAVCIDPKTNKVLIAQRSTKKGTNPSKWEFGCAKANKYNSLEESMKIEYKNDFGINIKLLNDKKRKKDTQPIPIAVYSIKKEDGEDKGIIFLAEVIDENIQIKLTNKHQEVKFISEKDISNFQDKDCIPDFKETLKKVFDIYRKVDQDDKS